MVVEYLPGMYKTVGSVSSTITHTHTQLTEIYVHDVICWSKEMNIMQSAVINAFIFIKSISIIGSFCAPVSCYFQSALHIQLPH